VHHNGLKTAVLLAGLSALIVTVGGALGGAAGLRIAIVIALVVIAVSYFFGDRIALHAMRARPVGEFTSPGLYRVVRELSTRARRPMPRLYVSPTSQPNAFATGRSPRRAAVCCTYGLLDILDEDELRGVLAHELSHVYNRDVLISSIAGALAAVITFVSQLAWLLPLGDSEDEDGQGLVGALLFMVLGPVAAMVIQTAISRSREYQADESGARLTGDPLALARALRKIEIGTQALPLLPEGQLITASHLMIANPFRGHGFVRMFSTHPPTAERVRRLEKMAGYRR